MRKKKNIFTKKKQKKKKKKTKNRRKNRQNRQNKKSGVKINKIFQKARNKGKNMIHSLHRWTDLPDYINKGSKCQYCKAENTIQYIRSGDLIDIVTQHIPIYYRCKACRILKF